MGMCSFNFINPPLKNSVIEFFMCHLSVFSSPGQICALIKQKETTHTLSHTHGAASVITATFLFTRHPAESWKDEHRVCLRRGCANICVCFHVWLSGLISRQPPAVSFRHLPDINRQRWANICLVLYRKIKQTYSGISTFSTCFEKFTKLDWSW